jgi:hypothetical protein
MKTQTKLASGALLTFLLTISVFAFSNSLESKIRDNISLTKGEMENLQYYNDKYRSELSIINPRVAELESLIQNNKDQWHALSGQLRISEMYLHSLMTEDQSLKD